MDRGLYLAASGMLAEQLRQDQIANDLANSSTAGYKAERTTQQSFGEMLLTNSVTSNQIGRVTTGVSVTNTVTDWSPQPLKDTGEPLDFAINGDGFFAVQTGDGTRYTRNGQFMSDAQALVAGRVGVGEVVGDGVELRLLRLHARRGGSESFEHLFLSRQVSAFTEATRRSPRPCRASRRSCG